MTQIKYSIHGTRSETCTDAGGEAGRQAKSLQSIHIHSEFDRICCRFGAQVVETSLQT